MTSKKILFLLGTPFSPFYSLLMQWREKLYRWGIFRTTRVGVPVVSIGNLTMGGSGKTPVVQYVARFLLEREWRPAVVSRGYGGASKEKVNVVSDGRQVLLDAVTAGDEPRFLAETLPGVPVLTGPKRRYPAARAVENGADILVLDDGFQHMALGRDVDLVLFNADFLAGNSRVFPGGDLREPVKSLHRCHGFVITGISDRNRERAEQFKALLQKHFPEHDVFLSSYQPSAVLCQEKDKGQEVKPLTALEGKRLFGFSGIAHPENFHKTLKELGCSVVGFKSFADHYSYSDHDLHELISLARAKGADACITTEKDLVKLNTVKWQADRFPFQAIRMEVLFENDFDEFLLSRLNR